MKREYEVWARVTESAPLKYWSTFTNRRAAERFRRMISPYYWLTELRIVER